MTFRRTRRTNDLLGWLTFGACLLGVVVGCVGLWLVAPEDGGALNPLVGCWTVAFALVAGFAGWHCSVRPRELEFVVEGGVMRWGRANRLNRQQKLPLADIRRVMIDDREQRLVVETKAGFAHSFGDYLLLSEADRMAFVEFLKLYHPCVPVAE